MDLPFIKEAISQLFSKPSTAMYPAVPSEAAENYRGRIVFHPDKCINCMMCERVCSGNAISHTVEKTDEGDKVTRTFYLGSCTFCATCMDFCGHGAIEFTRDYHMIATKEEDLMVSGTFIKKPPVRKAPPAKPAAPAASAKEPAAVTCETIAAEEGKAAAPAAMIAPRDDGKPVQVPARCVYCTLCAKKCPAGALTVDRAAKTWTLDEDLCVGCGTCAEACTKKAILMPGDEPVANVPAPKPAPKAAPAAAPAAPAPKAEEKPAEEPKAEEKPVEAPKAEEKPAEALQPRDDGKPVQDPSKCVYCTICAKKCPAGALTVDRAAKTWTLDEDLCVGCGTCAESCPKKAILI